jgi:hypothetical protein
MAGVGRRPDALSAALSRAEELFARVTGSD